MKSNLLLKFFFFLDNFSQNHLEKYDNYLIILEILCEFSFFKVLKFSFFLKIY
jgi:hypothetical protein